MTTHVELSLLPVFTARARRELSVFVSYCVARTERMIGRVDRWVVSIVAEPDGGYTSTIAAIRDSKSVELTGSGRDAPLAAWAALSKAEDVLREAFHAT